MARIPVVRFTQKDFTLYSGVMTVGQLMDHAITTEWDPSLGWELSGQGYQRAPLRKHYLNIAAFLRREGDPLLPNNALLATRDIDYGVIQFTSKDGDLGYLEVPDYRRLFIIDYQHRWRGFIHAMEVMKQTSLRDVRIPVTILSNTPTYEEMKQFYLINNKQKRVDTDLALTLMQAMSSSSTEEELANLVGAGNRYRIKATRLVVKIAQQSSGPWVDKIEEPNTPSSSGRVASIKSFVDSLRPIVSTRSPIHHFSDSRLVDIITSVWDGVLNLHPEWKTDPEEYSIQKSIGLFVIHRVTRDLLIPIMRSSGNWSDALVTNTMRKATQHMGRDVWRTGGPFGYFSSGAGQKQLAELIIDEIVTAGP